METKNTEPKERTRKAWKHGERTQKMVTFRLDNENLDWLNQQTNKGRYINTLIAKDRDAH